jgi:hypothetical protein
VLSVVVFLAQPQAASSVTNLVTLSKAPLSVVLSVQVQAPSTATPKTRTNTKNSTVSLPSPKTARPQTLRFFRLIIQQKSFAFLKFPSITRCGRLSLLACKFLASAFSGLLR